MRKTRRCSQASTLLATFALTAGLVGFAPAATSAGWASSTPPPAPLAGADGSAAAAVPELAWRQCEVPGQQNFECATARVPLNYARPRGRQIDLAVIRHRATDQTNRMGSVFFNPGGPGGAGTSSLPPVAGYFAEQVRERFDLVSWDPRGVGQSTAVQCFANEDAEDAYLSKSPSIPVGRIQQQQLIKSNAKLGRKCARRNGSLLRHVSTADTARDLDLLRAAVGDPKLNYYGISYGTFLGATYANMFPDRVRAVVLDGDVNPKAFVGRLPTADGMFVGTFLRQKSDMGSGKTLNAFLDLCGRTGTANCAFSAGSAGATRTKFAKLARQMRRHSLDVRGGYTYAQLIDKTASSIYYISGWPQLAQVLQDVWTRRVTARSAPVPTQKYAGVEQALAIMCGDSPNPPASTFPAQANLATDRSGATGPYWAWTTVGCPSWPVTAAQGYDGPWNRRTASRVLVIGNTYDPATPYEGSVAMSQLLGRARLLTVDGYGHTALLNPSMCANSYSTRYFIDGSLPPKGSRCSQDQVPFTGSS